MNDPAPRMRETLVFLPTHNEYASVTTLVPRLLREEPHVDLLIIDDGSRDGTAEWCESHARSDDRVIYQQRWKKLGLGSANVTAMQFALRSGYRYLATMDADRSHDARDLPRLLARIRSHPSCDVVIGSRYVPGGRILHWPWSRRFTSRLVNGFARIVLRIPVADCSSGFRCYRVATLARVDWRAIRGSGYEFYEQILWVLHLGGARFAEVPITFVERAAGNSKATTAVRLQSAWNLLTMALPGHRMPTALPTPSRGESSCCTGD